MTGVPTGHRMQLAAGADDGDGHGVVLGVDVGGTGIKAGPVDLASGALTEKRRRILTPQPATPAAIADAVQELVSGFQMPGPVGVALPAVVRSGIVNSAANIDHDWLACDAAALMAGATGRRVRVLNDADAAGLAEMRHGAGRETAGVVVLLTLGTGIGSAVFVDGALVPNTELGHLPLRGGDAEAFAAASVRIGEGLTWAQYADRLQEYLDLVERLLWPDLIIIGGGVSKKSHKFLSLLSSATPIVPAALRNDAGIVGAAMATQH